MRIQLYFVFLQKQINTYIMAKVTFLDNEKTHGQFTIGEHSTSFWASSVGYKYSFWSLDFCDIALACLLIDDAK